jgi:hypothetical protein
MWVSLPSLSSVLQSASCQWDIQQCTQLLDHKQRNSILQQSTCIGLGIEVLCDMPYVASACKLLCVAAALLLLQQQPPAP